MASNMSSDNISICVPRVFPNITWTRVKDAFEELDLGKVERVDMVNKTNDKGEKFKRVFVHFKHWNNNKTAQAVKEKLMKGDSIKVVYDDPWFWKVYKSNAPKPTFDKKPKKQQQQKPKKTTARLMGDDEHPGAPTPAAGASQISELMAMMKAQQEEMAALRMQLDQARSGALTPPYCPPSPTYSPPYGPATPTDELNLSDSIEKPKLVRQQALGRDVSDDEE